MVYICEILIYDIIESVVLTCSHGLRCACTVDTRIEFAHFTSWPFLHEPLSTRNSAQAFYVDMSSRRQPRPVPRDEDDAEVQEELRQELVREMLGLQVIFSLSLHGSPRASTCFC